MRSDFGGKRSLFADMPKETAAGPKKNLKVGKENRTLNPRAYGQDGGTVNLFRP
jgi:hypothetical protein